jgi:hypothetical protein
MSSSHVSYELRTPWTLISGYVELLLENEQTREKRDHLAIVERNAHRCFACPDLPFTARLQTEASSRARRPRRARHSDRRPARPRAESAQVSPTVDGPQSPNRR